MLIKHNIKDTHHLHHQPVEDVPAGLLFGC